MIELTKKQLTRQDFVDNSVFELINLLKTTETDIEWNIEMIAEVREAIKNWIVYKLELCNEQSFYPFLDN